MIILERVQDIEFYNMLNFIKKLGLFVKCYQCFLMDILEL